MPLFQNIDTQEVVELPQHIGEHPVLGSRYVAYTPEPADEEDDTPRSLWPDAKPAVVETPPTTPAVSNVPPPAPFETPIVDPKGSK